MALRIAKVDYNTFKKCVDFRLWGSKNTLNHWNKGDYLAFKVGDFLLGIAEVTGEAFFEDKVVWENGVFSNRLPLSFIKVYNENEGINFNNELKDLFLKYWGIKYGWVILNKKAMPEEIESKILKLFSI